MADIKKFLDKQGVSTLWSKIAEKVAADVAAEASARDAAIAQAVADEATARGLAIADVVSDVEALEVLVGKLPEGTTAKDVVDYVNIKTAGIATDAALGELQNQLNGAQDAIDAIEADYLKAADKTELAAAAKAADDKAVAAQGEVDALETLVGNVTEGKTVVQMIADAQTAATYDDTALSNRVSTLEGEDTGKSVRTIANEELAAQLVADDAKESLDTLAEIAAWIQSHPDDASAMNEAITALQNKVDTGNKTVSAYVTDAIAALSIGDYAKAADLTALAARVKAVEDDYLKAADKTELTNAINLKADQTALDAVSAVANAAATKTYVDGELAKKATQADLEAEVTARQNAVQANADAISGEITRAKAAEKANANAITAIKDHATVDSFADVMTEIAKKQDIIPANTYDVYGAAAQALTDANAYTDTEIVKIQALSTTEINEAIAAASQV